LPVVTFQFGLLYVSNSSDSFINFIEPSIDLVEPTINIIKGLCCDQVRLINYFFDYCANGYQILFG